MLHKAETRVLSFLFNLLLLCLAFLFKLLLLWLWNYEHIKVSMYIYFQAKIGKEKELEATLQSLRGKTADISMESADIRVKFQL